MPACRRRRIYVIGVFVGMVGAIFLCFQLFSVQVLHSYSGSDSGDRDSGAERKFGRGAMPRVIDLDRRAVADKALFAGRSRDSQRHGIESMIGGSQHSSIECTVNCSMVTTSINSLKKINKEYQRHKSLNSSVLQGRFAQRLTTFDSWSSLEKYFYTIPFIYLPSEEVVSLSHAHRGVDVRWQHLYEADSHGQFTCLFTKEKISSSLINDDYCDCIDSTDEPGTSACPQSRFYCQFQSSDKARWLPSGHVNDGLCDCCDGSDEWMDAVVPARIRVQDPSVAYYGLRQAPCADHCTELRAKEAELVQMKRQGMQIKSNYISEGRKHPNPDMLYGLDSEFYPLSQNCWKTEFSKYTYSICPFGSVKQTAKGSNDLVIGKTPEWLIYEQSINMRLRLNDGESINCPEGKNRVTMIIFACGIEDKIASLTESETCVYTVHFITPAAC